MHNANPLPVLMIILAGALLLILVWWLLTYNRFIRLRNHVIESWADVDVVLKRRYELIPNLVETVKGYAKYEQDTLQKVLDARSRALAAAGPVGEQARNETSFVHSVNRLLALAEDYPDLKASQNYLALQRELADTEDRIAAARRFYNANVRDLNTMLQSFPSSIIGISTSSRQNTSRSRVCRSENRL